MKNLVLAKEHRQQLPFKLSALQAVDDKIIASSEDGGVYSIQASGAKCIIPTKSNVLAAQQNQKLVLAFENGEIHVGNELIGSFPQGIIAAQFSQDGRYLALVTSDHILQLMDLDNDYDISFDLNLASVDLNTSEHVSIGWGRKETQFHGSAGKAAAQALNIVLTGLTDTDTGLFSLSWRADGAFFALNFVSEFSGEQLRRILVIDVLNRKLSAVSEAMTGLEGVLAWKLDEPSSIFMASTQLINNVRSVVFIERNGLKHREFPLRRTVGVQKLAWSECGQVLVVVFLDGLVQLWTMQNYHWYLKSEYKCEDILDAFWKRDLELVCATPQDLITRSYLQKFSSESYVQRSPKYALVGVVDGTSVLITPFSETNVPPPLYHFKVDLGFVPEDICLYDIQEKAFLQALYTDKKVHKYELIPGEESWSSTFVETYSEVDGINLQSEYRYYEIIHNLRVRIKRSGELIIDDVTICRNCISFHATEKYFLLTTSDQKLHFLAINPKKCDSNTLLQQMSKTGEDSVRMVERGAEILTVSAAECSLILQMPRGNLEIIYPRPFIFERFKELLGRLEYSEAYQVMRRHRIDLNVLVDYNTAILMSKLKLFVEQLKHPSYLNLFIAGLVEGNVAKDKYNFSCESFDFGEDGKVNSICKALVPFLDPKTLYEPLITCYASMNPQNLRAILHIIINLDPAVVEKAIKYALFLIEPERLYNTALSIYNLPLALSLAKRSSNMDPQEYLPFLEQMAELENSEMRFRICDYLKEFEEAIRVLLEIGDEGQVMEYVQRHNLYKQAIKVCDGDLRKGILIMYSEHCQDPQKALLLAGSQVSNAKWEYLLAGNAPREELEKTLEKSPDLELAVILQNWQFAAGLALNEEKYIYAQRYAKLGRLCVKDKLREASSDLISRIKDVSSEFENKMNRLLPLQTKFINDPMAALLLASGVSDEAASQMSFVTKKTAVTSLTSSSKKSKKKYERNKLKDKPGSPFEREFLHNCLLIALQSIHKLTIVVGELKEALELEDLLSDAEQLCNTWNKCVKRVRQLQSSYESLFSSQLAKQNEDTLELRALLEDHAKMHLPFETTPLTELTSEFY